MKRAFGLPLFAALFIAVTSIALLGQASFMESGEAALRRNVVAADGAIAGGGEEDERAAFEERVRDGLPGRAELQAVAAAYPERTGELELRNEQWALQLDDTWYHWADGRLLPEENLDQSEEFASLRFYSSYELGPLEMREVSPELAERLHSIMDSEERRERSRFNAFNDKLYGVSSRVEAERLMEWMNFLGKRTRVHPMVVEPLKRVDGRIARAAESDRETARFLKELFQIHGYNWRNIAGTGRRSYHAYGVAVDLLPIRWHGGWAYWQWAYESGIHEWWNLDLDSRWQIPQPIIDAFEAEGFIWGGKWLFFDNMHFEYRPESFLLLEQQSEARKARE